MFDIFKIQNRFSVRIFRELRNIDYLVVGIMLIGFFIAVFIYQRFYIFTSLIVFVFLYFTQELYRRKSSTLDIYYLLVFPFKRSKIIKSYLFSDLLEYKSVAIVIFLILICFTELKLIVFITFLFISFSFLLSLYNFIVIRYNTASNIHIWLRTMISLLVIIPFINIFIGTENSYTIVKIMRDIENTISNHIVEYSIAMMLFCMLIYFCVLYLIKRILLLRPFTNYSVIKNH